MLTDSQDAYGHEIHDYFLGQPTLEIVERDDGYIDISSGPLAYFAPYRKWLKHERQAIRFARGRVLDIGCGAGRILLHLQEKGHLCTGIDLSPLAVKVSRERGAKDARVMSITQVDSKLGLFDSIVMFGNNFGLFGSRPKARRLLERFHRLTSPNARIIAETADPYLTDRPEHLWYHKFNRRRGRMSGQLRIRIRHRKYVTPWFDYLLVSREEMKSIFKGTGWGVRKFIDSDGPRKGFQYIAVIEKE